MAPPFPAVRRNSIIRGADRSVQSDGRGRSRVSGENFKGPINCHQASASVTIPKYFGTGCNCRSTCGAGDAAKPLVVLGAGLNFIVL
jgi:hypothetical protein